MASSEIVRTGPCGLENFSRNAVTRMGISLLRSRSGGSLICTTFSRKYKSWRKVPERMAVSRSRLVAAMTRTFMCRCSGERALAVTEKLGFDQRGHQCGAVHGRKRPLTARPGKMNAARHELFPRSTFPEDENWVLVLAHFLDHLVDALHFHRDADQPAEPRTRPQLLAEQPVLLLQVNCFGHAFEAGAQLLNAERFRHTVHGAQAGDLDCRFDRSVLR